MTNTTTPGPLPPPPRAGHGCLWGCLTAALIALAAVVGGFSYLGWYVGGGFKDDPGLHMAMARVNADPTARAILGDGIAIAGVSGTAFSDDLAAGKRSDYVVRLKGSRGEGTLAVTIVTRGGARRITALTLTGPDGSRYDLDHPAQAPPDAI
ncbi:MAG TPA: cytochrome c oxidase assembly factor Coa1 family protein [Rhizomicrobium sp.]